jgi:hypothetical protein
MDILLLGAENMFSGQQKVEAIKPVEPIKKTGQEKRDEEKKDGSNKEKKLNQKSVDASGNLGNNIDITI